MNTQTQIKQFNIKNKPNEKLTNIQNKPTKKSKLSPNH